MKAEALREQSEVAQQRVESLEVTRRELTRLMGTQHYGKRTLRGDAETPVQEVSVSGKRPSLSEAVQIVMRTRPGHTWNAAEIEVELTSRGWMPPGAKPMATLRAALFRLNRGHAIQKAERGRYCLVDDESEPRPAPHPGSMQDVSTDHGGEQTYPLAM